MKPFFLSTFLLLAILICGYGQTKDTISGSGNPWDTVHPQQQALLYKPAGFDPSKKYPVIVFLHGLGKVGSNIGLVAGEALPKLIENGQVMNSIVAAPQCANGTSWYAGDKARVFLNWLKANYPTMVDETRCYVTGMSLGGQGVIQALKTNDKNSPSWAAAIGCCSFGPTPGNFQNGVATPTLFVGGDADNTQKFYILPAEGNPNNTLSAFVSNLNNYSTSPVIPIELNYYQGLGHQDELWDGKLYDKSKAPFNFEDWLLNFSTDKNYTATQQTALLTKYVTTPTIDYDRALFQAPIAKKYIDGLAAGTLKTSLTAAYNSAMSSITNQGTRYLIKFGTAITDPSTTYNTITSGGTGSTISAIKDVTGTASNYYFQTTTAASTTPTAFVNDNADSANTEFTLYHNYFGLAKGFLTSGFRVKGNTGVYKFTNLNASKTYRLLVFSSYNKRNTAAPAVLSIGLNGVSKYLFSPFNTVNYIEFSGIVPAGTAREIIFNVSAEPTLTSPGNITKLKTGATQTPSSNISEYSNSYTYINGVMLIESDASPLVRKGNEVVAISTEKNTDVKDVKIYPNPVNDQFQLTLNNTHKGELKINIVDIGGRAQKKFSFMKDQNVFRKNIGIAGLSAGSYLVEMRIGDWKGVKSIVKQ